MTYKGEFMKRIAVGLMIGIAAFSTMGQGHVGRLDVKIVNRQDSNVPYSYVFANQYNAIAQTLNLRGATFTLLLPDGDSTVVNCTSKFQERFAGPGNVRSCHVPLVDDIQAEFNGDKAKLIWPVSLDGKKMESETYKIIAVNKARQSQ